MSDFINCLKKYRRSSNDSVLGGVCGGLGEFTNIPSWVWRVVFAIIATSTGFGIFAYLAIWLFAPSSK